MSNPRETNSDGRPFPAEMTEQDIAPQVKRFIEMAQYNPMDGRFVIGHFRSVHGTDWTLRVLHAILRELREPSMDLDLSQPREAFVPFYEDLLAMHRQLDD